MINDRTKYKIGFISLGCDKNRVDLEKIIAKLKNSGYQITNNENDADVIIINTCSFIQVAREESIDNILRTANLKSNNLKKIVVTGCLNEMNYSDLCESLPEVDKFVRVNENKDIVDIIDKLLDITSTKELSICSNSKRILTTPMHYAYLKIADGCNNFCTYCTIPYIRGRYKSVSLQEILNEANVLVTQGVSELILVAQDVTKYGSDFNDGTTIVSLIKELSKISNLKRIRLLYCYPENITDELINEIATNNKVCKYIDIPLQHISNTILKKMNRKGTKEQIIEKITKLRLAVPNIAIRTTFILGFPNETEDDFNELIEFVKSFKLNNVGFFKYSREEGTPAYNFENQIPENVKDKRLKEIAKIQFDIVKEINNSFVGKKLNVVVDSINDNYAICRSEYQCPEVDGIIIVKNNHNLSIGSYQNVKINKTNKYDLEGEILWKKISKIWKIYPIL